MRTIWKYEIRDVKTVLALPEGSTVLHVSNQRDTICLWVEVDDESTLPAEMRAFELVGTGHPVPTGSRKYLGTVKLQNDTFIFHAYELLN
jgi:hypothetical protein